MALALELTDSALAKVDPTDTARNARMPVALRTHWASYLYARVRTAVKGLQDCADRGETGTPRSTTRRTCRRLVRSAARSPSTTITSASYPRRRRPFDRLSPIAAAALLDAATSAGTAPVTWPSSITASAYLP